MTDHDAQQDRMVCGAGSLERRAGFAILRLQGAPYEMGRQHGTLLRADIQRGAVPRFGNAVDRDARMRHLPRWQRALIKQYLRFRIYRPLARFVPPAYRAELRGLADGAGLPYDVVFRANFLSELGQVMAPGILRRKGTGLGLAAGGCTAFAAVGPATRDGGLLHAKNQDYEGIGVWDRVPTIIFCRPDEGFAYVKVTSAGLLKGNASMNEHGLTISGHFLLSDDVVPDGRAFTVLENEVMRRARTLDEAVAIVEAGPRAGAFGYLISDGNTGEAVALECNRSRVGKRPLQDGTLVLTNFYSADEQVRESDLLQRLGAARNPLARYARMEELLRDAYGTIDPDAAASFLGDHVDAACGRERGLSHTIGHINTVTSAVFRPADRKFWAAAGTTPVSNNPYVGFDFAAELRGEPEVLTGEILQGNPFRDTPRYTAVQAYYRAAAAYEADAAGLDTAIAHLQSAIAEDPAEPVYRRTLARCLLVRGDAAAAVAALEAAVPLGQSPNEAAETQLLLGFACDVAGLRERAVAHYRSVPAAGPAHGAPLKRLNPLLVATARRHEGRPFTGREARRLEISFSLMTGLE